MRSVIATVLLLALSGPAAAAQLQVLRMQPMGSPPPRVLSMADEAPAHDAKMANLSPGMRDWVSAQARATLDSGVDPDPGLIAGNARVRLLGQDFAEADITALVEIVLMEAARQADADLHDMMEQVRAANERKAKLREAAAARKDAQASLSAPARAEYEGATQMGKPTCVEPCAARVMAIQPIQSRIRLVAPAGPGASPPTDADSDMDSLSDITEMDQLRLQMLMDRRSKAMETLSNLLKKTSDTAATITSNLK